MIEAIELHKDTTKVIVRMTIPVIASLLAKQQRITDIANILNQDIGNVSNYIKTNYDKLAPLIDNQDVLAAMHSKYIAQRAKDKIDDIFDSQESFSKKDLIPLCAVSDRHTQQYRLLSDKATHIVSMDVVHDRREDRAKRIEALRAEKAKLIGGVTEDVIDV